MYKEIVKPSAPLISLFKSCYVLGCQLDEPYGFPGDHQPDATMLFNALIDIYQEFLLLLYCCVLLEIKFATTTTFCQLYTHFYVYMCNIIEYCLRLRIGFIVHLM